MRNARCEAFGSYAMLILLMLDAIKLLLCIAVYQLYLQAGELQ